MKNLKKLHKQKVKQIRERLEQFRLLTEKQKFKEFQFCLLTPQSNAQKSWQAVEEIQKKNPKTLNQITKILKSKTRFHNTKAKRILNSKETFKKIKHLLNLPTIEARNKLAKEVNGYGLKEASHFLRNIGLSQNKIAILDRHILKNLNEEKIKSQKHYLEIEQKFLKLAQKTKIPTDELDLLFWSNENGEIFK